MTPSVRMMVSLKQLSVFAAVVENRGFGLAAGQLGMGQSSVSHTLAALEKAVGAPLVTRSSPIGPTVLGQDLLPHAQVALAAVRAIDAVVGAHHKAQPSGTVRIAASPTASHRLVPDLLARWSVELPDVHVRLFEGEDDELVQWLDTGTVDCAILVDPLTTPAGGVELVRDAFRAVIRTDHPYSTQAQISLPELLEDPLLVSSSGCEPQIRHLHALSGVDYNPAQRVRELTTLLTMVDSDLGVAVMPALAATMLPETLTMIDLIPRLERRLVFAGPTNRPWNPHISRLRDIAATIISATTSTGVGVGVGSRSRSGERE